MNISHLIVGGLYVVDDPLGIEYIITENGYWKGRQYLLRGEFFVIVDLSCTDYRELSDGGYRIRILTKNGCLLCHVAEFTNQETFSPVILVSMPTL